MQENSESLGNIETGSVEQAAIVEGGFGSGAVGVAAFTKDLIKPRRLEFDEVNQKYGKFVAEPLERGYGTTLGNSLRRILLSSLPGAAIISVKINGVQHEFSTIDGCVEDVTEICLLYTSPSPRDLSTSRMPSSA